MCNTARGRLTRNEEMINSILTNAMHRKLFVLQFSHPNGCSVGVEDYLSVQDYPFNYRDWNVRLWSGLFILISLASSTAKEEISDNFLLSLKFLRNYFFFWNFVFKVGGDRDGRTVFAIKVERPKMYQFSLQRMFRQKSERRSSAEVVILP